MTSYQKAQGFFSWYSMNLFITSLMLNFWTPKRCQRITSEEKTIWKNKVVDIFFGFKEIKIAKKQQHHRPKILQIRLETKKKTKPNKHLSCQKKQKNNKNKNKTFLYENWKYIDNQNKNKKFFHRKGERTDKEIMATNFQLAIWFIKIHVERDRVRERERANEKIYHLFSYF